MDDFIDWKGVEGELCERLGFCGCGRPKESLSLINDLLEYVENYRSKPYTGAFQGAEWDKHCQDDVDALNKVIADHPDGIKYILFYLISDKDITEHGGSVPGWIEDYDFKNKLKSYIDYINS